MNVRQEDGPAYADGQLVKRLEACWAAVQCLLCKSQGARSGMAEAEIGVFSDVGVEEASQDRILCPVLRQGGVSVLRLVWSCFFLSACEQSGDAPLGLPPLRRGASSRVVMSRE
jgi:hypothetical protein